jgi:hypothetical protein
MTLTDRLYGWGAYYRWRKSGSFHVGSAEGEYRSPQPWDAVPVGAERYPFDLADVKLVEIAVSALDAFHRIILKGKYARRWSDKTTLRVAWSDAGLNGVEPRAGDFPAVLAMAHALVAGELARGAEASTATARERALDARVIDPVND